ncbi:hypothetical protein BJV82DRAFT_663442 [Fennellomyces sp. T-0311]|nr:hypothetical protein BJV82DRAFT_663442 [Fennellomyces sp. T-0311]
MSILDLPKYFRKQQTYYVYEHSSIEISLQTFVWNTIELIPSITQFETTLKELSLKDYTGCDLHHHQLLDVWPYLTYFTFLSMISVAINTFPEKRQYLDTSKKTFTKLIYLHMSGTNIA